MNKQAIIEKLERSAMGERVAGNLDAASSFELKAARLRKKYNLPRPEPVKETPRVAPQPVTTDVFSDFPGVPPPERPLTNAQLQALRDAAKAVGGRPLTNKEAASALGIEYKSQKSESGTMSDIWI